MIIITCLLQGLGVFFLLCWEIVKLLAIPFFILFGIGGVIGATQFILSKLSKK